MSVVQLLINGIALGALYALVTLGFVFVINATGAVNFAQGELVMAGGYAAALLQTLTGAPGIVILVMVAVIMFGAGLLLSLVAYFPLMRRPPATVFISTLLCGIFLQNFFVVAFGPEAKAGPPLTSQEMMRFGGLEVSRQAAGIMAVAALLIALQFVVFSRTRIGRRLEPLNLEYFEDPSWGIEGNAAVRAKLRIPIATNMYPNKFDDLGPAIRLGAVDIVLTDIHYWEGARGVKDLCAVCNTFNLGVAMHSGTEFGVELAAMLHTASTIPAMRFAGDAHYHYLMDDIIEGGLMKYKNGCIQVPAGPGLGVSLDEDKMKYYEKYYEEKGDYYARFHQDPYRPDWVPTVGGM